MIKQHQILEKATKLLIASPDLQNEKATIIQSEDINENPNVVPWIGVYPGDTEYEPARAGNIWRNEMSFRITVQIANSRDGNIAEQQINELEIMVIKAIMQNTSEWSNLLDMFTSLNISPGLRETEDGTIVFRESVITFTGFIEQRLFD